MQIETKLSKGHFRVEQVGMFDNEKLLVSNLKSEVSDIIQRYVDDMLEKQQFKEMSQKVADFIYEIDQVISDIDLESHVSHKEKMKLMTNELKRRDCEYRIRVECYLYYVKAKAAGINVTEDEINVWIAAEKAKMEAEVEEWIAADAKAEQHV